MQIGRANRSCSNTFFLILAPPNFYFLIYLIFFQVPLRCWQTGTRLYCSTLNPVFWIAITQFIQINLLVNVSVGRVQVGGMGTG